MSKQKWRHYIKQKLADIPDIEFIRLCEKIKQNLFQNKLWLEAETVGITLAFGREIETQTIIEKGWEQGKRIAVPKCDSHLRKMTFFEIESFEQLAKGEFHFIEPNPTKTTAVVSKENMDLLIVPGLVFDREGYRIGYGGGYYDRYLADFPHTTLSLALELQVVDNIPHEPYDIPVQILVTEKNTYRFQGGCGDDANV